MIKTVLDKSSNGALAAAQNESQKKPTAASRVVVFSISLMMILATVLFGMVDAGTLALFCLGTGLIGFFWLIDGWKIGELRYSRNLLQLPIIGLIVIGLIQLLPLRFVLLPENLLSVPASQALSLDAFATRLATAQLMAMLVCLAAALVFINTDKCLRIISTTIIILGFVMAVVGIIQYLGGDGKALWIRESSQAMPFASFINRHHFGALMEMTLGLTLGLFYTGAIKGEKRFLYFFATITMGVALILTSSRGALLSFLGILVFLTSIVFIERRRNSAKVVAESKTPARRSFISPNFSLVLAGFALILIIFVGVIVLGGDSSLLRSIGVAGGSGDVSSGRWQFWQTTLLIIRDYPLLGVGLDAFGIAYTRYDQMNGFYRIEQAHNEYLQVWAEAGIVGLVLILTFIFYLFRNGLQIFTAASDRFRRGVTRAQEKNWER